MPTSIENGRICIPDDAIGTEVTPFSDKTTGGPDRLRRWTGVDQRPHLPIGSSPDVPHRGDCACWRCGGWSLTCSARHEDGCVCWQCEPQRWRGERYRRLLRLLRLEREIYDAQNARIGVWDLLAYARKVGLEWLGSPGLPPLEAGGEDAPAPQRAP